ncbi:unnamed protein product [Symbiodinium sp. CCMP2592]|nr:unnamed protein product [Symbiodinium sp. CCMP2592]
MDLADSGSDAECLLLAEAGNQDTAVDVATPVALVTAFRVMYMAVSHIQELRGYDLVSQSLLARGCAATTHFSGVGCVEVAANLLHNAVAASVQGAMPLRFVAACDSSRHCANVLIARGHGCVFRDMRLVISDAGTAGTTYAEVLSSKETRPRLYFALVRRDCLLPGTDVADNYQFVCEQLRAHMALHGAPTIADICRASPKQWLVIEENRARSRRKMSPPVTVSGVSWAYLLTRNQANFESRYRSLWKEKLGTDPSTDENCLFDLSQDHGWLCELAYCCQDPDRRPVTSGAKRQIPTIRHGSALLWSPMLQRWLIPNELLVASGFPLLPAIARASGVPVDEVSLQWLTPSDVGNGMHIFQVGVFLASILSCVSAGKCDAPMA